MSEAAVGAASHWKQRSGLHLLMHPMAKNRGKKSVANQLRQAAAKQFPAEPEKENLGKHAPPEVLRPSADQAEPAVSPLSAYHRNYPYVFHSRLGPSRTAFPACKPIVHRRAPD
jgi:hypothetical protein